MVKNATWQRLEFRKFPESESVAGQVACELIAPKWICEQFFWQGSPALPEGKVLARHTDVAVMMERVRTWDRWLGDGVGNPLFQECNRSKQVTLANIKTNK